MKNDICILEDFIEDAFNLKSHLIEFLHIREFELDDFLVNAKKNLANLHHRDALVDKSDFYKEISDACKPFMNVH